MSNIIERIGVIIGNKNLSVRAFELSIGASNGMIGRAISKKTDISAVWLSKIIEIYPDINSEWLLTGGGNIFKTKTTENFTVTKGETNGEQNGEIQKLQKISPIELSESPDADRPGVQYKLTTRGYGFAAEPRAEYKTARDFSLRTDRPIDMQRVPLYDLNASAGLVGLFIDSSHQAPVDYISIPGLPRCDGAVHVCGDSMYPLLKSGDIVIYKEVNDIINNIFWGEMYMVSFDVDGEEYIAIKYVQRSDDSEYIRLVSYNTHHSPQDIKLSRVRALAIIKASVRFNTMG